MLHSVLLVLCFFLPKPIIVVLPKYHPSLYMTTRNTHDALAMTGANYPAPK